MVSRNRCLRPLVMTSAVLTKGLEKRKCLIYFERIKIQQDVV